MWKDLTMSQRADMMDLYLSKGITSLDDMRSLYDNSISDTAQGTSFSDGGSIHIKPENRGKFTALKERTGHSATWFKEHGTPAQKKMATFALNARHWKHGYGGNLYDDGGWMGNTMRLLADANKLADMGEKVNRDKPKSSASPPIITTGGAGYIPPAPQVKMKPIVNLPKSVNEARLRLYNMVSPAWGFTDDTIKATMDTMLHGTNDFVDSPVGTKVSDPYVDGVWAEYLQIPKNKRRSSYQLQKSSYRPTVGDASNVNYYTIPVDADTKARLVREGTALQTGKNKNSRVLANYNSGTHTIGKGRDSEGDYVSYYDRFDLNPFSGISSETSLSNNPVIKALGLDSSKVGDLSFGIGKPLEFYDRIHLDDYYNVPQQYRGTSYLPEITIKGRK
jgi:hypothetical protein